MDHDQVVRMTQMIEEAVTFGIRNGLPDAKERRRFQLLQTATAFLQRTPAGGRWVTQEEAVDEAEALLAEIERRNS